MFYATKLTCSTVYLRNFVLKISSLSLSPSLSLPLQFVSHWKEQYAVDIWCQNERTREKKKLWRKANSKDAFPYPWKEMKRNQ